MIRRVAAGRRNILFRNENPGGCEHLRPLLKDSVKDTDAVIVDRMKDIKKEIEEIKEMTFNIDNKNVTVDITCISSMHDGKNRKVRKITPHYNYSSYS